MLPVLLRVADAKQIVWFFTEPVVHGPDHQFYINDPGKLFLAAPTYSGVWFRTISGPKSGKVKTGMLYPSTSSPNFISFLMIIFVLLFDFIRGTYFNLLQRW
jgi:hypothetical protein